METELLGVELTNLHYQAEKASDTALGRTPALLIGKEALFGLVDANGHAISEKRLGQLLEEYQELSITASFSNRPEQTFSCRAAAVLKEPADKIYFSIDQAKALAEQYGQPFSIKEVLLTVKGETNFPEGKGKLCPDEGRLIKWPWPESREAQIRPQWWPSRQRSGAYRRRSSFQ